MRSFMLGDLIRRVAAVRGPGRRVGHEHHRRRAHDRRRHRHRPRQDGARRGRRGPVGRGDRRRSTRTRSSRTRTCWTSSAPTCTRRRRDHIPEMIAHHRGAHREGPRLRGRAATSTTTSPRSPTTGSSRATRSTALRAGHRQELEVDPNKRHPADFALWKHAGEHRLAEVAEPVGRGLPGLAHRVLGDVHEAPRRALRHPHRRQRQQVPPPRGRDRPVRGRTRPPGGLDLGARRVPADGRPEDGQVRAEHHRASPTSPSTGSTPSPTGCCASAAATGARWTSPGRRCEGANDAAHAAPPAHGRLGRERRHRPSADRTPPRRSTAGSGTRWPTTSTCRRPWWS